MKRKQSNDDVLPKKKVKPSNLCQHEPIGSSWRSTSVSTAPTDVNKNVW